MGFFSHIFNKTQKMIRVNVRLACIINTQPVNDSFVLELPQGSNLKGLIRSVESRIKASVAPSFTILVNGERMNIPEDAKRILNEGDNVSILSPIAGGNYGVS
jgi:molybdopterin converting factor small subunit